MRMTKARLFMLIQHNRIRDTILKDKKEVRPLLPKSKNITLAGWARGNFTLKPHSEKINETKKIGYRF